MRLVHEVFDSMVALYQPCMVISMQRLRSLLLHLWVLFSEIVLSLDYQALTVDIESIEQVCTLNVRHTI